MARTHRALALLLAGGLLAAGASTAHAKPAKEAKALAKKAKKALKKKDFSGAAELYGEAFDTDPNPAHKLGQATALFKGKDLPAAAAALTAAEEAAEELGKKGKKVAKKAAKLRKKIDKALTAGYGQVKITSKPEGATVAVFAADAADDAKPAQEGKAPWSGWLAEGAWTVKITLDEHEAAEHKLELKAGENKEHTAELKPAVDEEAEAKKKAEAEAKAKAEAEAKKKAEEEAKAKAKAEAEAKARAEAQAEADARMNLWRMVAFGSGAALLAGGGVFGFLASGDESELNDFKSADPPGPTRQELVDKHQSARSKASLANMLYIGGAVATATGVALLFVGGSADPPPADDAGGDDGDKSEEEGGKAAAFALPLPGGAMLTLGGTL